MNVGFIVSLVICIIALAWKWESAREGWRWARECRESAELAEADCARLRLALAVLEKPPSMAGNEEDVHTAASAAFDVSGKSRPIPWRLRKKELESQHRTKRKQIEEYRESA